MRRLAGFLFAGLALLHAAAFCAAVAIRVRRFPAARAPFVGDAPPQIARMYESVARVLPRLLRPVPRTAPLLIVTDQLQPLPFELHAAWWPYRALRYVDPAFERKLDLLEPRIAMEAREYLAELDRHGERFTAERYHDALAQSAFLIVFFGRRDRFLTPDARPDSRFIPIDVVRTDEHSLVGLFRVDAP